ncbi:MAG: PTS sugar transporter subunit IIA [Alphaproteobacteria bacterium]
MIGMVIVTHGTMAAEFVKILHHVVGPQQQIQAVGIGAEDDMDQCRARIMAAIKEVNTGKGVIMLTDMFGGTPSNLAIAAMPQSQSVVLAGVNLPMLVKLTSVRNTMSLLDAAREAEAAGRKYIQLVSENLAPSSAA